MSETKSMLKIYYVDVKYLEFMRDFADSKVPYSEDSDYGIKPFFGPFHLMPDKWQYFVPLSSAKSEHKTLDYNGDFHLLVYEPMKYSRAMAGEIIKPSLKGGGRNKLLSVLQMKYIIPVPEQYRRPADDFKQNQLLQKEFRFLDKNKEKILASVNRILDDQLIKGKFDESICNLVSIKEKIPHCIETISNS